MSTLHPKFTVSVYQPGVSFNEEPFDVSRNFGIYTLKKVEPSETLTDKWRMTTTTTSLWNSPTRKIVANRDIVSQGSARGDFAGAVEAQTPGSASSKLKSKLTKDVELANELNKEESARGAVNSRDSRRPADIETDNEQKYLSKSNLIRGSPQYKNLGGSMIGYTPRTARSRSQLGSTQKSFLKMRTKTSQLRHTLYYDQRINSIPKTALKNQVIEDIIEKEDAIITNPALMESIIKLRDMKLLKPNSPSVNRFKGVGKVDHVYNDFHSRSTNPGYSRNTGGVMYFR